MYQMNFALEVWNEWVSWMEVEGVRSQLRKSVRKWTIYFRLYEDSTDFRQPATSRWPGSLEVHFNPDLLGPTYWSVPSFDFSSPLFSLGLTVERTTMNLFSTSNQNGAPSMMARMVTSQPAK